MTAMPEDVFLFVYGTLRPPRPDSLPVDSFNYPKIAELVRGVTPARLPDAVLYDFGSFPGARPGAGTVIGEILQLAGTAFRILDPLEGHPDLYRRELVTVETDADARRAWVYWAAADLAETGTRIENGDWLHR